MASRKDTTTVALGPDEMIARIRSTQPAPTSCPVPPGPVVPQAAPARPVHPAEQNLYQSAGALMRRLARTEGVTLICGRFEGVDERVLEQYRVEEVSLGDFVMTGGEIAAQALIDATVRLMPNVLGNAASVEEESFSSGLLEHPQYTRPAEWQGRAIPDVLMSGHHGEIARWRRAQSERITRERRPDLWAARDKPD